MLVEKVLQVLLGIAQLTSVISIPGLMITRVPLARNPTFSLLRHYLLNLIQHRPMIIPNILQFRKIAIYLFQSVQFLYLLDHLMFFLQVDSFHIVGYLNFQAAGSHELLPKRICLCLIQAFLTI